MLRKKYIIGYFSFHITSAPAIDHAATHMTKSCPSMMSYIACALMGNARVANG